MKVGGRDLDVPREAVEQAMRGIEPESIQKHLVEMVGTVFPPKQVLAHVTGWDRQTFTTMEARRVLTKLGFVCRLAGASPDGGQAWVLASGGEPDEAQPPRDRIAALAAALATAQEAIAGLRVRVQALEDRA